MRKIVASFLLLCLFLTGCISTGNRVLKSETSETLGAKIVEGKTTKQEIKTMFGEPFQVSFTDSGMEIYHYEFTEAESKAINFVPVLNLFDSGYEGTKKSLVVLFDKNNVVTRYSLDTSAVDIRRGLFK